MTLAGTGTDPEGQTLTYDWTAPSGITLSSATAANPTFTAPDRTADYTLTFSLKVNDETSDSAADTVDISITADNDAPGAPSLTDQTATVGQAFSYQFAAVTDPEGATPAYTAQTFTASTRTFAHGRGRHRERSLHLMAAFAQLADLHGQHPHLQGHPGGGQHRHADHPGHGQRRRIAHPGHSFRRLHADRGGGHAHQQPALI